jgi:hypothetical protein
MHQLKSLCVVTIGTNGGSGLMTMMAARGSIGRAKDQEIIVVDIAEDDELDFVKKAGRTSDELVKNWQGPTRAPSSKTGERRLFYTGNVNQIGSLAARVAVMHIKAELGDMKAIVGLSSTYGNNDAILID